VLVFERLGEKLVLIATTLANGSGTEIGAGKLLRMLTTCSMCNDNVEDEIGVVVSCCVCEIYSLSYIR
jgi:hypothetical protein